MHKEFGVRLTLIICLAVTISSCSLQKSSEKALPKLGRPEVVVNKVDGKEVMDTIPHRIADFSFLNQDSSIVNNESLAGKIYVADFFFTSCPTICPKMKKQLLRVYDQFVDNDTVMIVSHSIDPKHDSVAVLREFSKALGVSNKKWHFLTGDKEEIYQLGEKSYMVTAGADKDAPGGYIHSGAFLLVDSDRRIRGVYDGTVPEQVDLLILDIRTLLNEEYHRN